MAKLLDKITDTIKKASDTVKNVASGNINNSNISSNSNSSTNTSSNNTNDGGWIGSGTSKAQANSGTYGTSTNYGSYKDDLDRLTEAKRKSQINALKQARQKALDNLDVQAQEIKPTYQNARNQTSASSQTSARSFAEYLANRGLANSGASAQGEINRLSSLQNNLGNINTAEANAFRDIANQRTAVENDYVANLANANSAIDSEYYNNLLNYNQQQREYINNLKQQANYQYANDYQAQINNLLAQGYSPDSLEVLQLNALRGNKTDNFYSNANTPSNALASIQAGNINYNNASALGWTVEQAQNYYNQLQATQQAQAQKEAEQLAWNRKQDEIANAQKWAQINNDTLQTQYNINKPYSSSKESNPYTVANLKNIIENNFAKKQINPNFFENQDGEQYITTYDKEGIINQVEDLYMDGNGVIDKNTRNLIYDTYGINY